MSAVPKINFATSTKLDWFEDIEIKFCGRTVYLSVQADHKTDIDGNAEVTAIYYDGQRITALPALVDVIERSIEDERP